MNELAASDSLAGPDNRLPIGVVLPTLNVAEYLPEHLASMRDWLQLVEEIVVVDSESSDGTVEMLQAELGHDRVRYFSRPRGLYQAWNFGVAQVRAPYTYVSTVGDSISRDGLAALYEVACSRAADVVISPPRFVNQQGQPATSLDWPIQRLIRDFDIREPVRLTRCAAFGIAVLSNDDALLGSSASNLYNTRYLADHPFPAEFGTAGDCAWALANGLDAGIAILPVSVSTFRIHEKAYAKSAYAVEDRLRKLNDLAVESYRAAASADPSLSETPPGCILGNILAVREAMFASRNTLSALRQSIGWRWVFSLYAWRARLRRSQERRKVRQLAGHFMNTVSIYES